MASDRIAAAYQLARQQYAELGVDVDAALARAREDPHLAALLAGRRRRRLREHRARRSAAGSPSPGNYPGKARTPDELRADLDKALSLIPGTHRLNLHASYAETGGKRVDRDAIGPEHFAGWIDWAQVAAASASTSTPPSSPTPRPPTASPSPTPTTASASSGSTTASPAARSARPSARRSAPLASPTSGSPTASKDTPVDRKGPRERLTALARRHLRRADRPAATTSTPSRASCSASARELRRRLARVLPRLRHHRGRSCSASTPATTTRPRSSPTRSRPSCCYLDEILLHVSRGVRWDSDHVVTLNDELMAIAQELVRGDYLDRVHIGLDFFDASINRVAAWVIGTRNMLKALLLAPARADRDAARGRSRRRLHRAAGAAGRAQDAAVRRGLGPLLRVAEHAGGELLARRGERVRSAGDGEARGFMRFIGS